MEVLLVDDHPMVNAGLASLLEETGRFTVAGQVTSLTDAKRFIEETEKLPSLIILDIMLGEENGLDFLPFLKHHCAAKAPSQETHMPPVLVCSVLEDPFNIQTALNLGASGYISKTGNKPELLDAIDTVLRGEVFISSEHSVKLGKSVGVYGKFTQKEMIVLGFIKQNKNNKEIAKAMNISLRTVENYLVKIYSKTGCKDRQDLLKL